MNQATHMFPAEHQDKFAQLRAHFLSGLPKRETELEDLTATLLIQPNCSKTLENLYVATHKLAGICATYGLASAGVQAARVEEQIEQAQNHEMSEDSLYEILAEIELLSDELRRVVSVPQA
ncbi:hypothetical protein [Shimia sp.]|uniref:hypothetical protein n=1 Tax=Shimia sp. TaxID=1954381 RepID=UPI003297B8A2